MFYLSKLLGSPVRDVENKPAGTLDDLVVTTRQAYPVVTAVGVKRRGRVLYAPWDAVTSFEESGTLLHVAASELVERELAADELHLSATFLDKQLVDTEGRKVIRVNDIQLVRSGDLVQVAAVDVSSNAILRRVGLAKVGERIAPRGRRPRPHLIDWKDVDIEQTDEAAVRLAVPQTKLELLHPADIADLVHELSPEERAAVFDALEDDLAADTFEELHPSYQATLLLDLPDEKASEILNEMSPDDAADLLADLPDDRRRHFIAMMEKDDAEDMLRAAQLPRALRRRHHDDQLRLGAPGRHRLQGHRASARAGRRGGDRLLHLRGRPLRAPARRLLAARAGHDRRRTGRSASS